MTSTSPNSTRITLRIAEMHCVSCATTVRKILANHQVTVVHIDVARRTADIECREDLSSSTLLHKLAAAGYPASIEQSRTMASARLRLPAIICSLLTLPMILGMIPGLHHWLAIFHQGAVQAMLATPVVVLGIWLMGKKAISSVQVGSPGMEAVILLGAISSYCLSLWYLLQGEHQVLYFESSASIITFQFLGKFLEERALLKAQAQILHFENLLPSSARVLLDDGTQQVVPRDSLTIGMTVVLGTGDVVPADASVISGSLDIDEAIISGESTPVTRVIGERILEGSVVVAGGATAQVIATTAEGTVAQITNLLKQAQQKKPRIQALGDRASAVFIPIILVLSALTFTGHYFVIGSSFQQALIISISVLVIACPCAMGLATPAALMVALSQAAKRGVLVKSSAALETVSTISSVFFDKTGTITSGVPKVSLEWLTSSVSEDYVRSIVATLEQYSSHPVAKAFRTYAQGVALIPASENTEQVGVGVRASIEGAPWELAQHPEHPGKSVLSKAGEKIAVFQIAEQLVPHVVETLRQLSQQGLSLAVVSGDSAQKCHALGLEKVVPAISILAECSPAQKVQAITDAQGKGARVMFVGDGVNDAAALQASALGVSISSAAAVTKGAADVVIVEGDAQRIITLLCAGKSTVRVIKQNLFWAFAYNLVAIPMAISGLINPTVAALAMSFSDVVVIGNSLRLMQDSMYRTNR